MGIEPLVTGFPGIGDSRYFINKLGIPLVSWGPGGFGPNGEITTHVPNEYICISELIDFAKVLAATIMEICGYET
jgi:acetylornithine deacetylase/succinyl-diaminopimelate desuccinylase-like protein